MYVELPQFKRCCFCIPLRYGLLGWGYIRLIASIIVLGYVIRAFPFVMYLLGYVWTCLLILVFVLVVVDVISNILLVTGAHKKNAAFINYYYYYGLAGWIVSIVLLLLSIIYDIYATFHLYENSLLALLGVVQSLLVGISNMFLQYYVLLLVRSEVIKLRTNTSFQFVNNEALSQCTLTLESNKPADVLGEHNADKPDCV